MDQENSLLIEILYGFLGDERAHNPGRGQISFDCPVCSYDIKGLSHGDGKGNLEVNYEQHVYKCWACSETHGTHGHLGKLIDKFGRKKDKETYQLIRPDDYKKEEKQLKKVTLPKEYKKFSDVHPLHIPRREAYNYLIKRGVTDEMILKYDIGYVEDGEYRGKVIIPSYNLNGELNYFIARSWNPRDRFKYKNPEAPKELLIFNESRIDWDKDIWLVEGVFDGLFVENSIPLLGKFLSDLLWETLYDKANGRIIVCLDGDAWLDAIKIYDKLSGGRLYSKIDIVKLPLDKDLGDLRGVVPEGCFVKLEK
jgi:DNA primase